jgi:hypothetical protein
MDGGQGDEVDVTLRWRYLVKLGEGEVRLVFALRSSKLDTDDGQNDQTDNKQRCASEATSPTDAVCGRNTVKYGGG